MKNNIQGIMKNKGFRNILLKLALVIVIGVCLQLLISAYFVKTNIFKEKLDIPKQFYLETPNLRTILINAFLFGVVVFFIVSYKKILKIPDFTFRKDQVVFGVVAILLLIGQYYFKFVINQNLWFFLNAPIFWGVIKILITILFAVFLALAIFGLDFTKYFIKEYKKEILIFFALSIAFFFLMLLVQNLWSYFSGFISNILYHFFSLFFKNVTYQPFVTSFTMAEGGGPLLGINGFKAIVGKPCSGIDSFLLFTCLYSLIFILDYKRLKKGLAVGLFFVGVVGMFFVNILRIFLLFMVGAFIDAKFAIGAFHSNIGWILFIIYFFIYWWIVSKYVYKKDTVKK
jgi:exosortase/archaeosortase family protein